MDLKEFESLRREHKKSGLSEVVFCKERGICRATYRYWKKKRRLSVNRGAGFVEIHSPKASPFPDAYFECAFPNGRILRIPQKFDPLSLESIVSALDP